MVMQKQPPEALFRSISLVVVDNAASEWAFVSSFFGPPPSTSSSSLASNTAASDPPFSTSGPSLAGGRPRIGARARSVASSADGGESVAASSFVANGEGRGKRGRGDRTATAAAVVEGIWKNVMDPTLEYHRVSTRCRLACSHFFNSEMRMGKSGSKSARFFLRRVQNFTAALLESASTSLSPVSLLSMIRLNDALRASLSSNHTSESDGATAHNAGPPALDSHLVGIRLQLWPAFQKAAGAQVESVRKLASGGAGGMFGGGWGGGGGVKEATVREVGLASFPSFETRTG